MPPQTKILYEDEVVQAGAWGGVIFEIWKSSASGRHFRDLGKIHFDYASAQPDRRVAIVSVVQMSSFGAFGAEARKELEARSKKLEAHTRASVVVLPAQGFAASVVRGILTGLTRASGSKVPTHVSASPAEGFAWLAPQLPAIAGRRVMPDDLGHAYDSMGRA